jgi:DHA1 family 2-module integral membrane pump EmrD-like MFS transporter
MQRSHFVTTVYLLLLTSVGYVATDIYLPSLPALAAYFGTSESEVQLTLFTYLMGFSLIPLMAGPLSDQIGRRKIILAGILISIFAAIGCLFSPTIHWLSFFRLVQGIGMGCIIIATRASAADLFTGRALAKQMSLTTMLIPLVLALAPTLGGFLQETYQWQAVFVFLVCYLLLLFAMAFLRSECLQQFSERKPLFKGYGIFWKDRLFLAFAIPFVLPSFGLYAYFTASPFLFQNLVGLTPLEYGSLGIYVAAMILVTGYVNLRLIHYFSNTQIIYAGSFISLFAGGLLLVFHMTTKPTTWSILIPCLFYFTCLPLCIANAAAKCMSVVKRDFGAATALLTTFQFLIGALASLIFALVSNESVVPLAMVFIFVGAMSFLGLHYACKLEEKTL